MSQLTVANPFASLDVARLRQRTSAKWTVYPDDVLPLWVAEMDAVIAPQIAAAVQEALENGDTGYPFGPAYANALASFASDRWGWTFDPAATSMVADVMSGVKEVSRAIGAIGANDAAIIVTPPVYPPFFMVANKLGRPIVEAPLDAEGRLDEAALEAAFTEATAGGRSAIMLLCNPHNPTGTVHTRAELEMLASLARKHGVRVVSDEIHSPLIMPTATFTPYLNVAGSEHDFAVVSASKGWNLAGFKAALVVAGSDAADELKSFGLYGAGHIAVIAHTAAFNHARDWLDGAIAGIDANRQLLGDLLETHLPEVRYQLPEATYLAWLDCRDLGLGDDPAAAFLENSRVALSAGTGFGAEGNGFARLNLATSPEILTEAVERMANVRN
ncbi:MAG TPA: aminotransferase class I/II-fold pyridoxal phosphate-dependent enzyme [Thermomicrobiales bacterium]|nr:aminotransferase class I/II-fold pyridoxal phosphate-dependent enzyme [Thermomicrobiales bacterium]